jgi:hypothetical protein
VLEQQLVLVLEQQLVLEQVQELLLFCHKQRGQQQR